MRAKLNPEKRNWGHCEITERDYQMLRFLWKWKLVSSTALARRFFFEISPLSAYRRLQLLETDGYLKANVFEGRGLEVWGLTDKGFAFILPKLGDLKQRGYKSENIYHDYLSTAFHLGEWLTHQPDNSGDISEQQLRRLPADAWPDWVPRSATHRPDGYSVFIQGQKRVVVAFETELSVKERSRYEAPVAFYDSEEAIQFVFWLVQSKVTLNALKKSFEKFQMRAVHKHQFIMLSDFLKNGWQASIADGQLKGKSLIDVLPRSGVVKPSQWHRRADACVLLDSRRRPVIPEASATSRNLQKAD